MSFKELDIEGIGAVKIYKRKGASTIRMSFDSNGRIRISQPSWLPYDAGVKFARQKSDWILSNKPSDLGAYNNGDKIGKAHRLKIVQSDKVSTITGRVKDNEVIITLPYGEFINGTKVQDKIISTSKKALNLEATQLLPQRLEQLASKHGFDYRSVSIKQLKTKWGSCSQHKDITLNYYLIQLPWELIDYVLLHELVHTEHMNHGQDFWQKFESILPNAKQIRKDLKHHKTTVVSRG